MKGFWPGATDPIVEIIYQLVVGFDEKGQPIYRDGRVVDEKEIEAVQFILEPLKPQPGTITSKPMGEIHLELASGADLTLRPVFHPPFNEYRDLFKVDHMDCPMPPSMAAILNRWREELVEEND